jgi:hypothetical protein
VAGVILSYLGFDVELLKVLSPLKLSSERFLPWYPPSDVGFADLVPDELKLFSPDLSRGFEVPSPL